MARHIQVLWTEKVHFLSFNHLSQYLIYFLVSATSKLLHLSKCVKIFSAFLNVIFEMCNIPIWLYLLIILSTSQINSKSTAFDASA